MVNSKEIRVGNYLRLKKTGELHQITTESFTRLDGLLFHHLLEPIKLTDELLVQIGLNKDEEGSYHILWDKIMMYKVSDDDWRIELSDIGCFRFIDSLHDLQNFWYAIHEEELELSQCGNLK